MISFTEQQLLGWITAWLLPFFRILGLFAAAPIFSSRTIPARAKLALAAVLAIVISPFSNLPVGFTLVNNAAWGAVVREILIGVSIGFLTRLILLVFELAGELIGLQIGLSYAGYFAPGAGHGNAVGVFTGTIASWLFVTMSGPVLLIGCLIHSYQKFPAGLGLPQTKGLDPQRIIVLLGDVFGMAVVLALPVIVLLLLVNFAMGVATKVAPQLNLFAVGFPILILCGLGMLSMIIPLFEPLMVKGLGKAFSLW